MNKAIALGVATAIGLAGLPAQAGDNAGMKYLVFPRVDMVIVDRDRNVDDGYQIGAGFGFGLNERWNFELNLAQGWHEGPAVPGKLETTSFLINALRLFYPEAKASPYFNLGVGMLSKDFKATGRSEDAMVEAGVGILIDAFEKDDGSRKLQIRPEVKVRYDFADGDPVYSAYSALVVGIGFQYAFGEAD